MYFYAILRAGLSEATSPKQSICQHQSRAHKLIRLRHGNMYDR